MAGRDQTRLIDRKLWSPTSGWVEWDPSSGTWVPMKPETTQQLALWADYIVEALPAADALCPTCHALISDHPVIEQFGWGDTFRVCPR